MEKNIDFWAQVKKLKGKKLLTKSGKMFYVSNKKSDITSEYIVIDRRTTSGEIKKIKIFRETLERMFNYILENDVMQMSIFSISLEFGTKDAVQAYSILASLPIINCLDKNGRPLDILKINRSTI